MSGCAKRRGRSFYSAFSSEHSAKPSIAMDVKEEGFLVLGCKLSISRLSREEDFGAPTKAKYQVLNTKYSRLALFAMKKTLT
jgi:hypothetical protein